MFISHVYLYIYIHTYQLSPANPSMGVRGKLSAVIVELGGKLKAKIITIIPHSHHFPTIFDGFSAQCCFKYQRFSWYHIHLFIFIYFFIYLYMYTYIYIYIYTHTYIYIHLF